MEKGLASLEHIVDMSKVRVTTTAVERVEVDFVRQLLLNVPRFAFSCALVSISVHD